MAKRTKRSIAREVGRLMRERALLYSVAEMRRALEKLAVQRARLLTVAQGEEWVARLQASLRVARAKVGKDRVGGNP